MDILFSSTDGKRDLFIFAKFVWANELDKSSSQTYMCLHTKKVSSAAGVEGCSVSTA